MKDASKFFKSALLVVFLCSLIIQMIVIAAGQPDDIENMPLEEIVHFMTRTHPQKDLLAQILNKANSEPEFREELVSALTNRLSEVTARIQISNTIRSLRDLNASETLMELIKIWNGTEKVTTALEFADMRIQLLITIAQFLPDSERILFLTKTESDTTEAPIVRFRATILLCATGEDKAIEHVLSQYEEAKKQFPITYYMTTDDQEIYTKRISEADQDGDMISSYIEMGMLLDPNNFDTDGDGLFDGNDRNPLCEKQKEQLSEDQKIAQFILYLHSRYYNRSRSPFNFKLSIVHSTDNYDGKEKKGLFDGIEFSGIEGYILHMNQEQIRKFRSIHTQGTSAIGIHKMPESKDQKDKKEFRLSISGGPGEYRMYNMTFQRFNNVWLPVSWELFLIT